MKKTYTKKQITEAIESNGNNIAKDITIPGSDAVIRIASDKNDVQEGSFTLVTMINGHKTKIIMRAVDMN